MSVSDGPGGDDGEGERIPAGARDALDDAIRFFQDQLGREIDDHTDDGTHSERPTTAREYFTDVRGWTDETLDAMRLGWAPADKHLLFTHLAQQGHDREAILGTGLFYTTDDGNVRPLWCGRYVLPYLDADGHPVYAIGRCTGDKGGGAAGYDGHPADFLAGKYAKLRHTDERVPFEEPIWGTHTLDDGQPVVVAEGIADAITAAERGYAVLSPVAKEFKQKHFGPLLDVLGRFDVPHVTVVPDAERATFDRRDDVDDPETIGQALSIPSAAPGIGGGLRTADYLARHGVDVRLADLPRQGLRKVDLDDYLGEWSDRADAVLASARPPEAYPEYDAATGEHDTGSDVSTVTTDSTGDYDGAHVSGDATSALWSLDIGDLTSRDSGDRGRNPFAHTGESENYFVVREGRQGDLVATDYKGTGGSVGYNALTALLVDAGERHRDRPEGNLSDLEVWHAWRRARERGDIDAGDPLPYRAVLGIVREHDLADEDEIPDDPGDPDQSLPADAYNAALEYVREDANLDPGREPVTTGQDRGGSEYYDVETCEPPRSDRQTADIASIRDALAGERYDTFVEADVPVVWGDDPGVGKTTTAGIAADERDRPHAVLFSDHEKAREFVCDEPTPDDYFHLKGGEQKREDDCLDADHDGRDCPDHPGGRCPNMCPVYDLNPDHRTRQAYEALQAEVGPRQAHFILADELHQHAGHDEDGGCPWLNQFDRLDRQDHIVGVHQYQTLSSVTDDRDVIIDEYTGPDSVADDRQLSIEDLTRMANALDEIAGVTGEDLLAEFGRFARDVIELIVSEDSPDLAALDAPNVDDHVVTVREQVGMPEEGHYRERDRIDETLARAKLTYHDSLLSRVQSDRLEWNGAPFAFDALLAAAAEAGLDAHTCRCAIAVPSLLDGCPRCGHDLGARDGARSCPECHWDEREDLLVDEDTEQRAIAWVATDHRDRAIALASRRLPLSSNLLDSPLVLSATPAPDEVAYLYGVDPENITVEGDQPLDAENLHVTQVLDGQYHWNTINQTDSLQDRIERTVDRLHGVHENLLVGGRIAARQVLDIPDDVERLDYHAARGKNRSGCDAAVAIGAPHPDVEDLRRDARLLAQGTDARVGGVEHSTRRDCPNPPVYRKLEYVDADGAGRAVPTKHYTGLVGRLFRQSRERELEQFAHRMRPLLADGTKYLYLLTNVPTRLPVDEVCSVEELADPLGALLPVPEGAIDLASHIRDVAAGDGPDGFRAESLIKRDAVGQLTYHIDELHRLARACGQAVSERTVRRWVKGLVDIGLLKAGEYQPREGVAYSTDAATLTQALSVLHSNAGVEVTVQRRLRRLIEESTSPLEWLTAAREVLGLAGDRCRRDNPPPGGTAGTISD